MKEYFKRITTQSKKWELVLWWIIRIVMIAGAIESFVHYDKYEDKIRTMLIGNFALTFGWEVMQMFPKTHMFRYIPSVCQDFTSVHIICGAFCGAYLNFYYKVWWWDTAMHFLTGGLLVLAGYVFMRAYEIRDNKKIPAAVIVLASFCISFMFSTFWECWEFSFDQLTGGDTQHWSYALALKDGPERLSHLFFEPAPDRNAPEWMARFALIDTMTDIVANTLGACIGGIALKLGLRKREKEEKAITVDIKEKVNK